MSRSALARWFASFVPSPLSVRWQERLRSCIGALIGIAVTGVTMHVLLGPDTRIPFLVAPMGASAVLLFAVPASPLAQPWSIIGGNLVSATVGVACAGWLADPVAAAALAVSVAICAMFALRCVHPPSGAVALTAVLGGSAVHALGFRFVLEPIAIQSAALLASALVYHALTGHRYPHVARPAADDKSSANAMPPNASLTRADLQELVKRRGELLDIAPDDLESLLRDAQLLAHARSSSELSCADVMSRNVVSVMRGTHAADAWRLLRRHGVKALPVTDDAQHVVGIVTRANLVEHRAFGAPAQPRLSLLRRFKRNRPAAAPVVGELMTRAVFTVDTATPIAELIPIFANSGHHHIPVLDVHRRLVGMITQADLISGLYRQEQARQRLAA
ncbi:HPP family protein [Trinickia terrae]|uniref:HPP family protein n=1 Tax=Trinickia terrae TaxID=2571161 RepID=A0A4U1HZZ9_9BURK|nr:HPP family protein [Trinickia terrae]TKC86236.1 HPP family protein [Trinickia terrae]